MIEPELLNNVSPNGRSAFKEYGKESEKLKKKTKLRPVKNVLKDPTYLKDLKKLKDQMS